MLLSLTARRARPRPPRRRSRRPTSSAASSAGSSHGLGDTVQGVTGGVGQVVERRRRARPGRDRPAAPAPAARHPAPAPCVRPRPRPAAPAVPHLRLPSRHRHRPLRLPLLRPRARLLLPRQPPLRPRPPTPGCTGAGPTTAAQPAEPATGARDRPGDAGRRGGGDHGLPSGHRHRRHRPAPRHRDRRGRVTGARPVTAARRHARPRGRQRAGRRHGRSVTTRSAPSPARSRGWSTTRSASVGTAVGDVPDVVSRRRPVRRRHSCQEAPPPSSPVPAPPVGAGSDTRPAGLAAAGAGRRHPSRPVAAPVAARAPSAARTCRSPPLPLRTHRSARVPRVGAGRRSRRDAAVGPLVAAGDARTRRSAERRCSSPRTATATATRRSAAPAPVVLRRHRYLDLRRRSSRRHRRLDRRQVPLAAGSRGTLSDDAVPASLVRRARRRP